MIILEQHLAHQREPVRMHTRARQTDQHVSHLQMAGILEFRLVDRPYAETSQIIMILVIHVRHFGRFAPDQSTLRIHTAIRDPLDNLFNDSRLVLSDRNIIQEEDRRRP